MILGPRSNGQPLTPRFELIAGKRLAYEENSSSRNRDRLPLDRLHGLADLCFLCTGACARELAMWVQ